MFSMKVERKFQLLGVDLYSGIPEEIISDEGGEFNAKSIYQNLYDIFKIKKLTTTSFHQQANGQCERFNRTMSIYQRAYWNTIIQRIRLPKNRLISWYLAKNPDYLQEGRICIMETRAENQYGFR